MEDILGSIKKSDESNQKKEEEKRKQVLNESIHQERTVCCHHWNGCICSNCGTIRNQKHDIEHGVLHRKERSGYTKIYYYQDQCKKCGIITNSYIVED